MMATDDKIIDEKLQNNINREVGKKSALLSRKLNEYLTDEETLLSNPNNVTSQINIFSLRKSFGKRIRKTG